MKGLRPYPAYRDSGAEWLGHLPSQWDVPRVKRVARLNPSKSELPRLDSDLPVSFVPMEKLHADGTIDGSAVRPFREVASGLTYFRDHDVLLAKITPCFENGKCAVVRNLKDGFGFGSTEYHVLRANRELTADFLYRILSSKPFLLMGEEFMEGSAGQKRVPTDFVANLRIPLPPLPEQQAIARFLDRQDRRISRFIQAKRRLTALLTEQKQAIIHQAVTRGLDPTVPLKPSGIDWLGDVPAHWEVRRMKSIVHETDARTSTGEEELLSLRMREGLVPHGLNSGKQSEPHLLVGYKRILPGQLVMNRMRASIGLFAVADSVGLVSPDYATFNVTSAVNECFVVHLLKTPMMGAEFRRRSSGLGTGESGFLRLYSDDFRSISIPFPPLTEQNAIAEHLEWESDRIATAITRTHREIELIREYRTRLIADVVTGKVNVRDHPDAAEHVALDDLSTDGNLVDETASESEELDELIKADEEVAYVDD